MLDNALAGAFMHGEWTFPLRTDTALHSTPVKSKIDFVVV